MTRINLFIFILILNLLSCCKGFHNNVITTYTFPGTISVPDGQLMKATPGYKLSVPFKLTFFHYEEDMCLYIFENKLIIVIVYNDSKFKDNCSKEDLHSEFMHYLEMMNFKYRKKFANLDNLIYHELHQTRSYTLYTYNVTNEKLAVPISQSNISFEEISLDGFDENN